MWFFKRKNKKENNEIETKQNEVSKQENEINTDTAVISEESKSLKKTTKISSEKTTQTKKSTSENQKKNIKTSKDETKKDESETKTRKAVYRVLYDKENRVWFIKKDGAKRKIASFTTKEEALARVKELSASNDLSFIVHKKDGKFQKK